jgi:hypothetical protein
MTATGQNLKRLLAARGWGRRPFPNGAAGVLALLVDDVFGPENPLHTLQLCSDNPHPGHGSSRTPRRQAIVMLIYFELQTHFEQRFSTRRHIIVREPDYGPVMDRFCSL